MKVALVHDWLIDFGGAEKVLEELLVIFPEADVYTLIYDEKNTNFKFLAKTKVITSKINSIPYVKRFYRMLLSVFPFIIEQFDFADYDLIISSSHTVAKGVITPVDSVHVCYCHSPARYCWDLYGQYMEDAKISYGPFGLIKRKIIHRFRLWDTISASRVDYFIANSKFIANRIMKFYKRSSEVIYPPVDIARFSRDLYHKREKYFVTCSRLVPYKKIDLIAKTFTRYFPDLNLKIIGSGPELNNVKACSGSNVEILGYLEDSEMENALLSARAFIYAAHEDFGISIVEALAAGLPVVAYSKGAASEILSPDGQRSVGLLFDEQTELSLKKSVEKFLDTEEQFDSKICISTAESFSKQNFQSSIKNFIKQII